MTDHSAVDDVASGRPYAVRSVNDHPPTSLDEFVVEDVVALVVEAGGQRVEIHGSVRRDGDTVLVYEKSAGGTGKDVRTWRVSEREGSFEIAERSVF
jgi:hypothetical protein